MNPPETSPFASRRAVAAIALAAFAVRLYIHLLSPVIAADSAVYLETADLLRRLPLSAVVDVAEVHPFYPLLTWLLGSVVPDLALAATLISLLASAAAVWPLHALFRLAWPSTTASAACLLFALHPIVASETADALPTATQILLFASALASGLSAFRGGPWGLYPLAGACSALAYLTRTEGLLSGLLLAAAGIATAIRRPAGFSFRRFSAGAGAALLAAVVLAGPYVAQLSRKAGRFTLTAKGGGTVLLKALQGEGSEVRRTDTSFPFLPTLWRKISYAFFAPLLPFLAAGFYLERRETRRRLGHLLIALATLGPPILLFTLNRHFRPSHRYFLTGVVLMLPWTASAMLALLDALRRRFPATPLPAAAAGVLLLALLVGKNALPGRPEEKVLREAGVWLAEHPPGPSPWRLVSSSDKLSWYARAAHVALAVDGADAAAGTLALCRAADARALAIDGRSAAELGGAAYLEALARSGFATLKEFPAGPGRLAVWILQPPPP
ncbi:MAG TPA: glycosyltransferase family 39 protein [Planctomycetota bacterium]